MERIYLYVAPEEYAEVRLAGAAWDGASKRWYVPEDAAATDFARWLDDDAAEVEFGISSDQAFVVSAKTPCLECRAEIEVICLYVERGFDEERGEGIERVTVFNVWAMDEGLRAQVGNRGFFREIGGAEADAGTFAHHCVHCGAVQADYRLHSELGGAKRHPWSERSAFRLITGKIADRFRSIRAFQLIRLTLARRSSIECFHCEIPQELGYDVLLVHNGPAHRHGVGQSRVPTHDHGFSSLKESGEKLCSDCLPIARHFIPKWTGDGGAP